MSYFLFAFEHIYVVKAWTTFGGIFRKPEQVTMSFPFVRCDKALNALRCLKNLEPPQLPGIRQLLQCQPGMVLPSSSTVVLRVMPGQSQMKSRTRGGSNLNSWLEPKWKQVRSSSSTYIFACIGTLTMVPIPGYDHKVFINVCVLGRYCEQCDGNGVHDKSWCIESRNLMPLATDKYSGNVSWFMKLE